MVRQCMDGDTYGSAPLSHSIVSQWCIVWLLLAALLVAPDIMITAAAAGAATPTEPCRIHARGLFGDSQAVRVEGECTPASAHTPGRSAPQTQTVACGVPGVGLVGTWNLACGTPLSCFDVDPVTHARVQPQAFATMIMIGGVPVLQNVWCPRLAAPMPSTQALRAQALRLLPPVAIGSAWTARALVHAQAILWADTAPDRTLTPVTVVGRRVALRISFAHATWDFGDRHPTTTSTSTASTDSTDTTSTPGKPYDPIADPCPTAQCPHYYGHTYTDTGPVTLTLTVAWHAQFRLDHTTTWTDVDPNPLTGPATTRTLTLVQARGILVPNPDH